MGWLLTAVRSRASAIADFVATGGRGRVRRRLHVWVIASRAVSRTPIALRSPRSPDIASRGRRAELGGVRRPIACPHSTREATLVRRPLPAFHAVTAIIHPRRIMRRPGLHRVRDTAARGGRTPPVRICESGIEARSRSRPRFVGLSVPNITPSLRPRRRYAFSDRPRRSCRGDLATTGAPMGSTCPACLIPESGATRGWPATSPSLQDYSASPRRRVADTATVRPLNSLRMTSTRRTASPMTGRLCRGRRIRVDLAKVDPVVSDDEIGDAIRRRQGIGVFLYWNMSLPPRRPACPLRRRGILHRIAAASLSFPSPPRY